MKHMFSNAKEQYSDINKKKATDGGKESRRYDEE
jgi:hypothetical protein